jgi:nucleotide-binding universal stress UspA family protein
MTYRDILVHIDTAASKPRYEIAAGLAARGSGVVSGVYLRASLINQYVNIGSIGYLPPDDLDWLIREHDQGQAEAAAAAGAALQIAATAAGVACAWRVIDGDTPDALLAEARRADVAVMPAPIANPLYNVHGSAVDVALGGGGPVLIVPDTVSQTQVGRRVLVAWNGSREAARALREALPLIEPDAAVTVLTIRAKGTDLTPDAGLARHLERLGFTPNLVVVGDDAAAEMLIAGQAKAVGADLIVMGLYGHARLQEFVLGGASRGMLVLRGSATPLLVAH